MTCRRCDGPMPTGAYPGLCGDCRRAVCVNADEAYARKLEAVEANVPAGHVYDPDLFLWVDPAVKPDKPARRRRPPVPPVEVDPLSTCVCGRPVYRSTETGNHPCCDAWIVRDGRRSCPGCTNTDDSPPTPRSQETRP